MPKVARHQHESFSSSISSSISSGGGNANATQQHNTTTTNTTTQTQTITETDQSPDALLAYELNQLSFHERNTINEEVHGVRDCYPEETPELLNDSLASLEKELSKIKHKPAYDLAQQKYGQIKKDGTYINTDRFRLIFLRCEIFNSKKAAARIVAFLELSYEICGELALYRDLLLSDFDSQALQFMRGGYFQILPGRDRSGRRVVGNFSGDFNPRHHRRTDRLKIPLYVMMQLVKDDIDAQRKGTAHVFWSHNIGIDDFKTRRWIHERLIPAMPVRINALHLCLPVEIHSSGTKGNGSNDNGGGDSSRNRQVIINMVKSFFMFALGPNLRSRLRIHTGSATECLYILQTFGIQSYQMPINTNTGKIKITNHHKYIELHRMKELILLNKKSAQSKKHGNATTASNHINTIIDDGKEQDQDQTQQQQQELFAGIECPKHNDILFGRGWVIVNHPGNALFRNVMENKLDSYDNSANTKREKTLIAWSIVYELRDVHQSRFLKEDKTTGWWIEVTNDIARQKVSIGFRDLRKARLAKLQQLQQVNSSGGGGDVGKGGGGGGGGGGDTITKRKCVDGNTNINKEYDVVDDDLAFAALLNEETMATTTTTSTNQEDYNGGGGNHHTMNHNHNNIARGNVGSDSSLPFNNMLEEYNAYAFLNMDGKSKRQRCNLFQFYCDSDSDNNNI